MANDDAFTPPFVQMSQDSQELKDAREKLTAHIVDINTPHPPLGDWTESLEVGDIFRCCVEMGAFRVMLSEVGKVPEKDKEYRNDSPHWRSRLCHDNDPTRLRRFRYVMVYGGVRFFDKNAPWCMYDYVGHEILSSVSGGKVGPYSNGYEKKFSGRVWCIQIGVVVRRGNIYPHCVQEASQVSTRSRKKPNRYTDEGSGIIDSSTLLDIELSDVDGEDTLSEASVKKDLECANIKIRSLTQTSENMKQKVSTAEKDQAKSQSLLTEERRAREKLEDKVSAQEKELTKLREQHKVRHIY